MLYLITPKNRHNYKGLLEQLFNLRYDIFINKLKWDFPEFHGSHEKKRELDQFDHENAYYLIAVSPDKEYVFGGCRIIQTTSRHMVQDVFKWMLTKISPEKCIRKNIWELSRFFIHHEIIKGYKLEPRDYIEELIIGLIETARFLSIRKYIAITDLRVERLFKLCGWKFKRCGPEHLFGDAQCFSAMLSTDSKTEKRIRNKLNLFGNYLQETYDYKKRAFSQINDSFSDSHEFARHQFNMKIW